MDKLYNGEVKLKHQKDGWKYTINGKGFTDVEFPSVTTVTGILDKPALRYWYVNQALARVSSAIRPGVSYDEVQLDKILNKAKYGGADTRDEAASVGKLAHKFIENYIERQIVDGNRDRTDIPIHTGARSAIEKFFSWEDEYEPVYIFSERKLASLKHVFCGTVDIVCLVGGRLCVADVKTSKGVYPEFWLQIAAYMNALMEERPSKMLGRRKDLKADNFQNCIIHLPKDPDKAMKAHWKEGQDLIGEWDAFLGLRSAYKWKEGK